MHKYKYIFCIYICVCVQNQKQARRSGQPFASLAASDPAGLLSPVTAWGTHLLIPTRSRPAALPGSPPLPQPTPHRPPTVTGCLPGAAPRPPRGPPPGSHALTPLLLPPPPAADLLPLTSHRQPPPGAHPPAPASGASYEPPGGTGPARALRRSPLSRSRAGGFPRHNCPLEQKDSALWRRWERRETAPQQQLAASPPPRSYNTAHQNIYMLHLLM